jgi:hypothetical protein
MVRIRQAVLGRVSAAASSCRRESVPTLIRGLNEK